MPKLKKLGIIYNPSESNSVSTVTEIKKLFSSKGITVVEVTVNNSADVAQAVQSLVGKVELLYFPQDNTLVSALQTVINIAHQAVPQLPVILPIQSDDPYINSRILASIGYDYYETGIEAGNLVARILKGEKAIDIPIAPPKQLKTFINRRMALVLGLNREI